MILFLLAFAAVALVLSVARQNPPVKPDEPKTEPPPKPKPLRDAKGHFIKRKG